MERDGRECPNGVRIMGEIRDDCQPIRPGIRANSALSTTEYSETVLDRPLHPQASFQTGRGLYFQRG